MDPDKPHLAPRHIPAPAPLEEGAGEKLVRHGHFRFVYAAQHIYWVGLVLHLLMGLLFLWLNILPLFVFNIFSVAAFSLCIYWNQRGLHQPAMWMAFTEVNLHALLATVLLGWDSGFFYYLLAVGPLVFISPFISLREKVLASTVTLVLLLGLYIYTLQQPSWYTIAAPLPLILYGANLLAIALVIIYLMHFYARGATEFEQRLRELTEAYEQLATFDSLTRLLNRRAMNQAIEAEVSRAQRYNQPFVLALGDIDNFKQINDHYGHQTGDRVLQHVAGQMHKRLRKHDLLSRWGGEEFLLLLANISVAEAVKALDEIRQAVQTPLQLDGEEVAVTITFGVCAYSGKGKVDAAILAADKALYEGKHAGKNQVVVAAC